MIDQPRATLADVARLSGVSAKTVSRVFGQEPNVSASTREAVLNAAKRLRYRPNTLARSLRSGGGTNTVAFVIGDIQNPFYFNVAAGIERELAEHGYTMILAATDDAPGSEATVVEALLAQQVRALLLIPIAENQSYLDGERQLGTPIIAVDRPARDLVADSVVVANSSGMAEAVRALTAIGHRRIGFVGNPSTLYPMRERLAGYREALREIGVTDSSAWERLGDESSESVVRDLLDIPNPPTAIVTAHNRATTSAIRALRDRHDVALIGFDDYDLAEMLDITVVAYDTIELGRRAAQLVMERLDDPTAPTRQVVIPTQLLHRTSGSIRPPGAG